MSKIFEAMKRAEEEMTDLVMPPMEEIPEIEDAAPAPPITVRARPPVAVAEPVAIREEEHLAAPAKLAPSQYSDVVRTLSLQISSTAPVLPFDNGHSRAAEQYRMARTRILQHPAQPRLLTVSSAGSGDGKTITAINLAGALALKSDANVLLVDADLRRSSMSSLLGLPQEPGLADVLSGAATLDEALIRVEQFPNLYLMPCGNVGVNPGELLDSPRWTAFCTAVRRQFKFAVFDTPPIGSVADYELIQVATDGVLLVMRPDHTSRKLCFQAINAVPRQRLIGVVMNCVPEWFLSKHHDYYYGAVSN